jgi:hypothetical protein
LGHKKVALPAVAGRLARTITASQPTPLRWFGKAQRNSAKPAPVCRADSGRQGAWVSSLRGMIGLPWPKLTDATWRVA